LSIVLGAMALYNHVIFSLRALLILLKPYT
jgi:hypothetical protein